MPQHAYCLRQNDVLLPALIDKRLNINWNVTRLRAAGRLTGDRTLIEARDNATSCPVIGVWSMAHIYR
jgi:hypothetical protein